MRDVDVYSTLEPVPAFSDLQVPIASAPETSRYSSDVDDDLAQGAKVGSDRGFFDLRRKRLWAMIVAALLVIIALAVGLGVGLHQKGLSQKETPVSSPIPPPQSPATRDESVAAAPLLTNSRLSAVAWLDQDQLLQKRVYYQDTDDTIKESSWNASESIWYVSNTAIAKAKTGSAIAVAVSGASNFQINLFVLNDTGYINEWVTKDGNSWEPGTVQAENIASSDGSLTTIWHQYEECVNCPNTNLLVYQDDKNTFNLGNRTAQGWVWSTLDANPISGSGASLALSWKQNAVTELRLYYQFHTGHLCSLDWKDPPADDRAARNGNWENRESNPLPQIPFRSQIASFTTGTLDSPLPVQLSIVSSGSNGVTRIWWTGVNGGEWYGPKNPPPMANVDDYTALAAHRYGNVYALQDGRVVEFMVESDATTWSRLGEVVTN